MGQFFYFYNKLHHRLRHVRVHPGGFLRMSRGGNGVRNSRNFYYVFGPQLNAFMSVGILLKYFRRKLLQFERNKKVSNLGMFRFKLISLTKLLKINSFSVTQQKTSWIFNNYSPKWR